MFAHFQLFKKHTRASWERKILLASLLFFLLFSAGVRLFAAYAPGATLNPACAPGAVGCVVSVIPDQTGNAGLYLTTDGAGTTSWAPAAAGGLTSLNGLTGGVQDFDFGTTDLTISSSGTTHFFSWSAALRTDNGGTGLSGMGSPNELLGVNSAGDALEYKSFATGTGNTGNDFNIEYDGAQIIFNMPNASASDRGVVTTGAQTLAGQKTFSLLPLISPNATPTLDNHLTTKSYVDTFAQGLSVRQSVTVATITAGTLATDFENGDTVDGVVLSTGDRILIKDQATGSQNGIYTVNASGAPTRATDFDEDSEVDTGTFTSVVSGGTNANTQWVLVTPVPITVGSTALTFSKLSSAPTYTTDSSLTFAANNFSINTGNSNTWTAQQTFNTSAPIIGTLTAGSVVFAGASKELTHDNSNFFWDDSSNFLGIGTNTPSVPLEISKAVTGSTALFKVTDSESGGNIKFRDGTSTASVFNPVLDFTTANGTGVAGAGASVIVTHIPVADDTGTTAVMSFRASTDAVGTSRIVTRPLFAWQTGNVGNVTRMILDTSGRLGINTTTPTGLLSIWQGGSVGAYGPGTVATSNSVNIVGTDTIFTKTFKVGDSTTIGGNTRTVATITDDTHMTITQPITVTASGVSYTVTSHERFEIAGNGDIYNQGSFFAGQDPSLNNIRLGNGAGNLNMTSTNATLLGFSAGTALTSGANNTFIGKSSGATVTTGGYNTYLGSSTDGIAAIASSVAIGYKATATASNQLIVGGDDGSGNGNITDSYWGSGVTEASPSDFVFNTTGGSGTDIAGANLILAGGKATGSAVGGSLVFKTSDAGSTGTTLQSLTEKMRIATTGILGLGTSSPYASFDMQKSRSTSSGAITMSVTSGTNTVTTSSSITLQAGDFIVPTTSTTMGHIISVGGTGTSFTTSTTFTANVVAETFTIYHPLVNIQGYNSTPLFYVTNGNGTGLGGGVLGGGVGIGTDAPDADLMISKVVPVFSMKRTDDSASAYAEWRWSITGTNPNPRNKLILSSDMGSGTYVNNFTFDPRGSFGIGNASPTSLLHVEQPTTGPGTVSVSGTAVTGSRTQFTNTFKVGDTITVTTTSGSETKTINTITSDTVLVTDTFTGTAAAGTAYTLTGGNRFAVFGNGNVGVGTATPSYRFHVSDTTTAGIVGAFANSDGTCTLDPGDVGGWSCPSDINLKKNIKSIDTALSDINRLRPVSYLFKNESEDAKFANGLIAQEVQEVFPGLVKTQIDGTLSLNYVGLTPFMIKAIQELDIKLQNISGLTSGGSGSVVDQLVGAIVNMKELIVEKLTIGSSAKPTAITVYDKNGNAGCMTIEDVNTGATKITPGVCTDSEPVATAPATASDPAPAPEEGVIIPPAETVTEPASESTPTPVEPEAPAPEPPVES